MEACNASMFQPPGVPIHELFIATDSPNDSLLLSWVHSVSLPWDSTSTLLSILHFFATLFTHKEHDATVMYLWSNFSSNRVKIFKFMLRYVRTCRYLVWLYLLSSDSKTKSRARPLEVGLNEAGVQEIMAVEKLHWCSKIFRTVGGSVHRY